MDPILRPSKYNLYHSLYDPASDQTIYLAYNSLRATFLRLNATTYQALNAQETPNLAHKDQLALENQGFLVPSELDELAAVLDDNRRTIRDSDVLYLVLQPSAYCPLGCHYCGQSHKRVSLKSSHVVHLLARIEEQVAKHPYRKIFVSWFGAEPLTDIPKLRELSRQVHELAQRRGLAYGAKIVTNGLLLSSKVAAILVDECKVSSFEITLDGTEQAHDQRRHTKAGRSTFAQIFANLAAVTNAWPKAQVIVRSNVDPRNKATIPDLLRLLADRGLAAKVRFYVAPIHAWGNDADDYAASAEDFADWEIEWFILMDELGFKLQYLPERVKNTCLGLSPHSHLIDPAGDLYGCTEVSLVSSYEQDGKNIYAAGNVADLALDDPAYLEKRSFLKFYDEIQAKGVPCARCPLLPACGGRCPKLWAEGHVPCPSFKYNFQDRMLLQYLKLQKHPAVAVAS